MFITTFLKKLNNPALPTIILAFFIIALASIIPILPTYGKLNIGGDIIIPLQPEFSYKNAYEWLHYTNGVYASNDNFQWITLFYIPTRLGLSIYQSAFLIQFLIFFLSGVGIYAIFHLWFNKNYLLGVLPAIAFIYSPHRYDHMIYFYGTATIIWLLFFLFKFIRDKRFTVVDICFIAILISFVGNLPNPKYHFFVFVTYILSIILALLTKALSGRDIIKNIPYFGLLILATTYLWVPFVYFGYSFSNDPSIQIPITTVDGTEVQTVDYGLAPLYKMLTLWHSPNLNKDDAKVLLSSFHIFFQYLIPTFIFGLFPLLIPYFNKSKQKMYWLYCVLALLFIFLAKSSNPPFGGLYLWLVQSHKIFAFLRTGAGIVIFAAIFYALCIGVFFEFLLERVQSWSRYIIGGVMVITILISGYHIWSGLYFRSFSPVNKEIDKTQYGLRVPEDYFKAANFLAQKKLFSKIEIFPGSLGYQNNSWGYFGPIIYPWIIDKPTITVNKTDFNSFDPAPLTNTRYTLDDKTLHTTRGDKKTAQLRALYFAETHKKIFSGHEVDIYQKHDAYYVPLFYTVGEGNTSVEYKAINPTLYKVVIHHMNAPFELIFGDNYHDEWNLYKGSTTVTDIAPPWEENYHISSADIADQASKNEVKQMIQNKNISIVLEKPLFVSKMFNNSVQNDNLASMTDAQSLLHTEIKTGISHQRWNNLNSWKIDPQLLCQNKNARCSGGTTSGQTVEILVQFRAQRLVTISYLISILSVLLMLTGLKFKKLNLW